MINQFALGTILILLVLPRVNDPDEASLSGRVTDEDYVAIRGATVSATNVFSREVATIQSDVAGFYKLAGLRQGRYSVFVQAESHGCKWVFNVVLFRGQNTQLDIMLARSQKKVSARVCDDIERTRK